VFRAFHHALQSRPQEASASVLDVGCGEGAFLRSLGGVPHLERHGIDISPPSIQLAAKALPDALFVVGNADRLLPYVDHSFDFVTSIDARLHVSEFERVLRPDGLILIAVPGPDDLIELREQVQGAPIEKARTSRIEREMELAFTLTDRTTIRDARRFEPARLRDLLTATYRGFRHSEGHAVSALEAMNVTLSHEVLAFERR